MTDEFFNYSPIQLNHITLTSFYSQIISKLQKLLISDFDSYQEI